MDQRQFRTALSKYTVNPVVKLGARLGIRQPGVVVLETTGRKTGKTRRNLVVRTMATDLMTVRIDLD